MTASATPLPRQTRTWKENFYRYRVGRRSLLTFSVLVFSILMLFPLFWMFLTSIRGNSDFSVMGKEPFAVKSVTFDHYYLLLTQTKFLNWMFNSLFVSLVSSVIALVIGLIAAYSFGRLQYKGGAIVAMVIFSTYLIPPVLLFIPLNVVVNWLKLSNNLWGLILTYQTFMVPFIAWMLASYFKGLPAELVDAARIDGASRLQAMLVIDIPLILPGIVSVFFFAFTLAWNEYLYAFTFMRTDSKLPVAVGVVNALQVGDVYFWGQLMAGAILGSVPVVIIYSFLMDYYLAGLTAGAVKG